MNIYHTVPNNPHTNTTERARVRKALETRPGIFLKAPTLATITGLPTGQTQVKLRKLITELIEEEHCPIVANEKGFSWASEQKMLSQYLCDLEARRAGLDRRIRAVREILGGAGPRREFCVECGRPMKEIGERCGFCLFLHPSTGQDNHSREV